MERSAYLAGKTVFVDVLGATRSFPDSWSSVGPDQEGGLKLTVNTFPVWGQRL